MAEETGTDNVDGFDISDLMRGLPAGTTFTDDDVRNALRGTPTGPFTEDAVRRFLRRPPA